MTRRELAGVPVLPILFGMSPADEAGKTGEESRAQSDPFQARWADLEKADPVATRALLWLYDRPREAVAFFKPRMKPVRIDAERVRELLKQLGSQDAAVWNPAFEELEYLDPRLAIGLEALMDEVKEAPARQRLVAVMSARKPEALEKLQIELKKFPGGFNFFAPKIGSWWAESDIKRLNFGGDGDNSKTKWTRAVRVIALLEHLDSPDAVAILKRMSLGHEEAQPTVEARAALKRVNFKAR
jgi:hypothetical protein